MARPNPLVLLLALAGIAVLAFWFAGGTGEEPAPLPNETSEVADRSTPEHAGGGVDGLPTEAKREEVAAEPEVPSELAMPHAFALRVRAIDEFGLPVKDQQIRLSPLDCTRNAFEQQTGEDGTVVLQWRGRTPSMRMAIAVGNNAPREITAESGSERILTMLASRSGGGLRFRISNSSGQGNGAFAMVLEADDAIVTVGSTAKDDRLDQQVGLHPEATFADRLLGEAPAPDSSIELSSAFSFLSIADYRVQALGNVTIPTAPTTGTLTGLVYTEDGQPAKNQLVCYGPTPDRPVERGNTDEQGQFRFENVAPGFVEVRAGGGAGGLARQTAQVLAGQIANATLTLRREQRIAGSAIGPDQKPLADWFVEYEALDGSWVDRTRTKDDGTFVLANLQGCAGRLLLRESGDAVPAAVIASALPDSGDVVFDLSGDKAPNGSIALRVPEPPATAAVDEKAPAKDSEAATEVPPPVQANAESVSITLPTTAEHSIDLSNGLSITSLLSGRILQANAPPPPTEVSVFAWQQDSRLGFSIPRAEDGSFACGRLPAGFYRLEFRCRGLGTVDLGSHWVDGKGKLDLGTVQRPEPGRCRLQNVPQGAVVELYHRREHGDVRAHAGLEGRTEVDLPKGSWLAVWRVGEGPIRVRAFALRSGEATDVDLSN